MPIHINEHVMSEEFEREISESIKELGIPRVVGSLLMIAGGLLGERAYVINTKRTQQETLEEFAQYLHTLSRDEVTLIWVEDILNRGPIFLIPLLFRLGASLINADEQMKGEQHGSHTK